jgi:hypothetical protein
MGLEVGFRRKWKLSLGIWSLCTEAQRWWSTEQVLGRFPVRKIVWVKLRPGTGISETWKRATKEDQ